MSQHRPRKRFGQNFLQDSVIIERIVAAISPSKSDHLVEIGPGLGAMTRALLPLCGEMDVIELDRDLIPRLEQEISPLGILHIHQHDALSFDFCQLSVEGEAIRVVGNLPYNISTPLLFHLVEHKTCLQDMHFMLQKEVVDRIVAEPGSKRYGRLSVMLQYHFQTQKLFIVAPGAFYPPPKVDSAIVRLRPYAEPPFSVQDENDLALVVTQAFSQRRKTLRNTLKPLLDQDAITAIDIDPARRPETLSVEEFCRLSDSYSEKRSEKS